MSPTRISCAPLGATQVRSGCAPDARRAARRRPGSATPVASSSAANARAAARLPAPRGRGTGRRATARRRRQRRRRAPRGRADGDRATASIGPIVARGRVGPAAMARGRLITIEGIDGAGKTTLARGLCRARCATRGLDVESAARAGRRRAGRADPRAGQGPGAGGRRARRGAAVRGGARAAGRGGARAAARRRQLGAARPLRRLLARLPGRRPRPRDRGGARDQRLRAPAGCDPDRTLLLRIDPAARAARARTGGREAPDRLEREAEAFFARIAAAYDELAAAEPERIRAIDATQPPEAVLAAAALAESPT